MGMDTLTAPTRATAIATDRQRRTKRLVRVLALTLGLFVIAGGLTACNTPQQEQVGALINQTRRSHGRSQLGMNLELTRKAQGWAENLAGRCTLQHSNLASGISYYWRALGENVGYGGSIGQVHTAYMNSPGHRANIVDPRWNYMGTGVAYGCGRTFTVQVFMQY
jgi:uncharacterized protein YkwD